ncbi:hypothetical protein A2856_02015 [Candidatus Uhrbacteria bacterium RIFCSPHIGHO2_01_FULL_63_20]|uniref:Glucose-6-phosphate dehydrogenase (NADP(+)) n=1 Tax=Candidatus Uhrbacteria bacterium RIFCSPHIGHO2_01_FULL_63_20 TaxID=1802385 RepID=A0A1F7TKD5_9BACT|nr:MAG: hypothetical protein A2856_02015 [Candidatus Uhrbacteria bacterium RIFCSPHIGHO2_01_FULL_63_20]
MTGVSLVVFGATGDLTQRKLYPSLYQLAKRGLLPKRFSLYGVSRKKLTDKDFQKNIERDIRSFANGPIDVRALKKVTTKARYLAGDLNHHEAYDQLKARLKDDLRLFYLALPPRLFDPIVKHLDRSGMASNMGAGRSRVIVEKPFGYDYSSGKRLERVLRSSFDEPQIFRIDHYLGKQAVQDLLAYRRGHPAFEQTLDARSVRAIRVDALEPGGLEARGPYYDGAGSIRDMTQNHLLQLVAFMTMKLPKSGSAKDIQSARANVLKSVRPFRNKVDLVIGQYRGYHAEPGVEKDSKTDTYSSLVFEVDDPRWRGVPISVRTGKRLTRKLTCVTVQYKDGARRVFQIDPHPGQGRGMGDYERLLLAAFDGDRSLFVSAAEVLNSWKAVDPFLKKAARMKPIPYRRGSSGPRKKAAR